MAAADPAALARVVDPGFVSGGFDGLEGDTPGVLIDDVTARRNDVTTGDVVGVRLARGTVPLRVGGVYTNENFIGIFGQALPIIVSPKTYALGAGDNPQDTLVLVNAKPGQLDAARQQMQHALARDFPNIDVLTRDEFRTQQQETVDQFLTVLVAILALSELIAILGIVNTLALSVFERTRELGLLRVVGMSRRQVRSMVRWESVVIALIGATIGIVLGLLWGWAFTRSLRDEGLSVFAVPWLGIAVFVVGSILAGVVAAILPAWHGVAPRRARRRRDGVAAGRGGSGPREGRRLRSLAHQGRLAQSAEHFLDTEGVRRSSRLPPTRTPWSRTRAHLARSARQPLPLWVGDALPSSVGCVPCTVLSLSRWLPELAPVSLPGIDTVVGLPPPFTFGFASLPPSLHETSRSTPSVATDTARQIRFISNPYPRSGRLTPRSKGARSARIAIATTTIHASATVRPRRCHHPCAGPSVLARRHSALIAATARDAMAARCAPRNANGPAAHSGSITIAT